MPSSTAILLFVKMAAFYWCGTFRQSWRNTGFRDLISLLKAVVIVTAIFFVGAMIVNNLNGFVIPLSVPLIEMCLSLLILSGLDRKSTRLNSSHVAISYAVFCLKQKTCLYSIRMITNDTEGGFGRIRNMVEAASLSDTAGLTIYPDGITVEGKSELFRR